MFAKVVLSLDNIGRKSYWYDTHILVHLKKMWSQTRGPVHRGHPEPLPHGFGSTFSKGGQGGSVPFVEESTGVDVGGGNVVKKVVDKMAVLSEIFYFRQYVYIVALHDPYES